MTVPHPGSAPASWLWSSPEPFVLRWRRSAAALVAIARALRERDASHPTEREFVRLYAWVERQDPAAFTPAWQAPAAFGWVRRTYEALARTAAEGAPPDALRAELPHLKGLALATALRAGGDVRFESPYEVRLPFSIPGTGQVLDGEGALAIAGARGGSPLWAGRARARPCEAPQVELAACRVRLDPFALRSLGADPPEVRRCVEAGLGFHAACRAGVRAALERMARFAPGAFEQFGGAIRCIALKPWAGDDAESNVSLSDLPGAFVAVATPNAADLADVFLHEFHHNRLFAIEDRAPLLEEAQTHEHSDERCYSPWREDPRPVRGLLHAVYVTVPVTHYWLAVLGAGGDDAGLTEYARDRVRRSILQMRGGLEGLGRLGRFTPAGKDFFEALGRSVAAAEESARCVPADVPAWACDPDGRLVPELDGGRHRSVRESVRRHRERYERSRNASPSPA